MGLITPPLTKFVGVSIKDKNWLILAEQVLQTVHHNFNICYSWIAFCINLAITTVYYLKRCTGFQTVSARMSGKLALPKIVV